jgi:plasmid stabilization system protein ParE
VKRAWSYFAREELKELRRYSGERWGCDVALRYLEDVRDVAKRLGADPFCARLLEGSFRICRVRSHYLIVHFDAAADRATVARVPHVAMDIERHLP